MDIKKVELKHKCCLQHLRMGTTRNKYDKVTKEDKPKRANYKGIKKWARK